MLFGSRARGANQPQDGAFLLRAPDQDLENEFVQGGVIDKLSLQFELGWKLLKALHAYE